MTGVHARYKRECGHLGTQYLPGVPETQLRKVFIYELRVGCRSRSFRLGPVTWSIVQQGHGEVRNPVVQLEDSTGANQSTLDLGVQEFHSSSIK